MKAEQTELKAEKSERLETVAQAFSPLRDGMVADGADMNVREIVDGRVVVELMFSDETCLECIMPKETLEPALLVLAREVDPDVSQVVVLDPRA